MRWDLPVFRDGKYNSVKTSNADVLAYARKSQDGDAVVYVNFTDRPQRVEASDTFNSGKVILSSIDVAEEPREVSVAEGIDLRPNEAVVIVAN